jgi:hypothetical protein
VSKAKFPQLLSEVAVFFSNSYVEQGSFLAEKKIIFPISYPTINKMILVAPSSIMQFWSFSQHTYDRLHEHFL